MPPGLKQMPSDRGTTMGALGKLSGSPLTGQSLLPILLKADLGPTRPQAQGRGPGPGPLWGRRVRRHALGHADI